MKDIFRLIHEIYVFVFENLFLNFSFFRQFNKIYHIQREALDSINQKLALSDSRDKSSTGYEFCISRNWLITQRNRILLLFQRQ